jgi:hypothetical protein
LNSFVSSTPTRFRSHNGSLTAPSLQHHGLSTKPCDAQGAHRAPSRSATSRDLKHLPVWSVLVHRVAWLRAALKTATLTSCTKVLQRGRQESICSRLISQHEVCRHRDPQARPRLRSLGCRLRSLWWRRLRPAGCTTLRSAEMCDADPVFARLQMWLHGALGSVNNVRP